MQESKHSHITLDGLRGVAAIAIAIRHMPGVFGGYKVPNAYLAVDFFLQLSGFIIAYAYSNRISLGMGFGHFLKLRIIRLYPSFIIGIFLSIVVAIFAILFPPPGVSTYWTTNLLLCSAAQNVLMLPTFICHKGYLFQLNPPMWSLFFEIIINIIFFFSFRFLMSSVVVASMAIITFALVVPHGLGLGNFDFGFFWSDFVFGLLRLLASFLVGVALYNLKWNKSVRSDAFSGLLMLVLGGVLLNQRENVKFEFLMIVLVFPMIVLMGTKYNPKRRMLSWISIQLGKVSYVLYVIHLPIYLLCYGLIAKTFPASIPSLGIYLGILMLTLTTLFSWGLSVTYEPVARAFTDKLLNRIQPRKSETKVRSINDTPSTG